MKGLSPAEGWNQLQGIEPRTRFDARIHYFLASDLRKLKVRRNGLTIQVGKQRFNYKGEETGERQGETVFAWWNPDCPDLLSCTRDLKGNGLFTVERCYDTPAYEPDSPILSENNRKIAAHNAYAPALYHLAANTLPKTAFRGQVVSPQALQLGEEMAAQQGFKRKEREEKTRLATSLPRRARTAKISTALVHQAPESLEYLGEFSAGMAELEKEASKEKNA